MNDSTPQEHAKSSLMRSWKSSANKSKLARDEAARQGEITHLAFRLLGGRDAALDFLNSANSVLGGRPIDLAIGSKAGFADVEQAIRQLAIAT